MRFSRRRSVPPAAVARAVAQDRRDIGSPAGTALTLRGSHAADRGFGVRSIGGGVVALTALAGLTACGAGQHAQTAEERPTVDGAYGTVGNLQLQAVSFVAPSGPNWPAGSAVPLTLYVANDAGSSDSLVKITSPSFKGWSVTSASSLSTGNSASGSNSGASSPSASASSSASSASGGSAQPQTIDPVGAVGFGLAAGYGASSAPSAKAILLTGLSRTLSPGESTKVTFSFKNAGSITMHVPVQITGPVPTQSVNGSQTSGGAGLPSSGLTSAPRTTRP